MSTESEARLIKEESWPLRVVRCSALLSASPPALLLRVLGLASHFLLNYILKISWLFSVFLTLLYVYLKTIDFCLLVSFADVLKYLQER